MRRILIASRIAAATLTTASAAMAQVIFVPAPQVILLPAPPLVIFCPWVTRLLPGTGPWGKRPDPSPDRYRSANPDTSRKMPVQPGHLPGLQMPRGLSRG